MDKLSDNGGQGRKKPSPRRMNIAGIARLFQEISSLFAFLYGLYLAPLPLGSTKTLGER